MHHDRNASIEIDNLEQKSRAELRLLWEEEFVGKAPPSLGRDVLALGIAYARQERRYGGLARPVAKELDRSTAANGLGRPTSIKYLHREKSRRPSLLGNGAAVACRRDCGHPDCLYCARFF